MKSYFKKKMLRLLLSLGLNEEFFSLKLEGPKMRYEPCAEHGIKKKVEKEIFLVNSWKVIVKALDSYENV